MYFSLTRQINIPLNILQTIITYDVYTTIFINYHIFYNIEASPNFNIFYILYREVYQHCCEMAWSNTCMYDSHIFRTSAIGAALEGTNLDDSICWETAAMLVWHFS